MIINDYMMTEEGDKNHIDRRTRERMINSSDDASFYATLLVMIMIFFIGMVCGSTLHDVLFHATEIHK